VPGLPAASPGRWRPVRMGLVDLFFYDYQEFWFRDGRLLLRGNNGTGKSKVLALTLPFLLDGRAVPARVEPDGDPQKRVEWNLLLGDRYNERTGYAWIEFARRDEHGEDHFLTAGCGLRAVHGRPLGTWFFLTRQRVARDLALLHGGRTLSRERLREALGEHGELFDRAAHYRRALDEALFRLGEARYESLLSLLVQLRQPQLSRRPDDRMLSRALTEALPPLDAQVLGEVAEAFRNLESERRELEGLREAQAALDAFREHHRRYARIAARRRGAALRAAHSRYEKTSAELGRARSERERAGEEERRAGEEIGRVRARQVEARTRERTLRESPEMRSAEALRRAEQAAREREADAQHAAREAADGARARGALAADVRARAQRVETLADTLQRQRGGLAARAAAAGLAPQHEALLAPLELPDGPAAERQEAALERARGAAEQAWTRREQQIAHLRRLLAAVEQADHARLLARERWQHAGEDLQRLEEQHAQAEAAVEAAAGELLAACGRWVESNRELAIADAAAVLARLEEWLSELEGRNPLAQAAIEAFERATQALAGERAQLARETEALDAEREALDAERTRLEAGEDRAPPLPHTRAEDARDGRPGAPLWRVTEFRDEVPDQQRAGLEAALEAAGLLDAWLLPDGELRDRETWDVLLVGEPTHARGAPPRPAASLDAVLRPALDRDDPAAARLDETTVAGVLAAIGCGESAHPAWVDARGRWRLGPALGAWGKPDAEYIGRGARDAARRRRMAEIAAAIAALDERRMELEQRAQALDARRRQLEAEHRSLPDDQPLRTAARRAGDLLRAVVAQRARVEEAARRHEAARTELAARERERDQAAADLALPARPDALDAVAGAVQHYAREASAFWPLLRTHWSARADLEQRRSEEHHAAQRLGELERRRGQARQRAQAATAERDTLRETVGESAAAVERRLADTEREIQHLEDRGQELIEARTAAAKRLASVEALLRHYEEQREEMLTQRAEAIASLETLERTRLLAAAGVPDLPPAPEGPWSAEHAVRVARALEPALAEVDHGDEAWQEQQRRIMERITELQATLSRHGHHAGVEPQDDLLLVRVVFQSRPCDVEELAALLAAEARERSELLDARERELLEEHLVNDLANHLQVRIQEAELAARAMNEELERRPTGTGMKLRLRWTALPDGESWLEHTAPTGLAEARRRLLRQSAAVWSAQDRGAVGAFLKKCIDDARLAEEGAALQDVLERALDYRYWHRFSVERWQDGAWRPAYGPASGGERALVVTIPLFAAASSHYSSADPHAPRLVLLDEAFAGVDDASRARCLGLLATFDMDVVMTSEREWGCYPEVPGLAIAHLARREDVDAVHVTTWWWDGRQRVQAAQPMPTLETLESAGAVS